MANNPIVSDKQYLKKKKKKVSDKQASNVKNYLP